MSGFAPFGRDDQPLLDVKIVGGKRVEIAVDHYGRPLQGETKPKTDDRARFTRSLSEERNVNSSRSSPSSSVPPWIRGETPPKKVLKPLQTSPVTTRQSSGSSSRSSGMTPAPPMVLPPIARQLSPEFNSDNKKHSSELLEELRAKLQGLDTAKLKDAYLHFSGLDSTFTGFVDVGQVAHVFAQYRIPIDGNHLDALTSKFMAARRPNWVNYEQMLKYVNSLTRNERTIAAKVPTLDFSSHSNANNNQEITLKPNQVSPRSDGSITGRQSKILVSNAFQDRQDAHLLVEMERLLKQVHSINELMWTLKETLNTFDQNGNTIINTQKLKSICLRHHLPFNGSLLDRILDKFDPRGTGRVDWTDFITFVERAIPLTTSTSLSSNQSRQSTSHSTVDTPPSKPSWETRQPLQALSKREQVIPKAAALQQEQMYDEHKRLLDEQLKDQSQQLSELLHKQQRYLDKRQKTLQTDHISDKLGKGPDEFETPQAPNTPHDQADLEEKQRKLLQQQFALIEQKRKINEEQEKLNDYVSDGKRPIEADPDDSPVKSFLRLAHALFLYDSTGSGFLEYDVISRLITNYNLVYRLGFSSDVIEEAIDVSSTGDGMVSIDRLLDELKTNLITGAK